MKEAIVNFSQQTGVVFTLLASISAGGLFLETLVEQSSSCGGTIPAAVAGADTTNTVAAAVYPYWTLSHLMQALLGEKIMEAQSLSWSQLAAPCFCASTFFNLYGLVNATNVLGRAQVVPTVVIKHYVLQNSWVVHSTYWALIPAIGTFGLGVVCTVGHLYGEPLTTLAFVQYAVICGSQARSLVSLGRYTEQITKKQAQREGC